MPFINWQRWLRRAFGRTRTTPIRRRPTPRVEALDDRCVPAFVGPQLAQFSPTEGQPFSGTVATFQATDTGPFTAQIDWGDGTGDIATIAPNASGGFDISGTHTYAEDGNPQLLITVQDAFDHTGITILGTVTVQESVLDITAGGVAATEGQALTDAVVATFTDPGSPDPASDFTATIDWGDGTSSPGTVVSASTPLAVTGFNEDVVFEAGANPAITRDFDNGGFAWFEAGATDTIGVTHADGLSPAFVSRTGTRYQFQNFAGNNALLLDANSGPTSGTLTLATPASYERLSILAASASGLSFSSGTVTVHYLDGTSDQFTYSSRDWSTDASFVFDAALPDSVSRAVVGAGNSFADADSQTGAAWQMFETEIQPDPNKLVASLEFGAAGNNTTGIFAVSGGQAGPYLVLGSHTYDTELGPNATYSVTVSEPPVGFTAPPASGPATVANADTADVTPTPVAATEGQAFAGTVGTFADTGNPLQSAGNFTATIDWGDGTSSAGTVAGPTGGPFAVAGTHIYAESGDFTVTAAVTEAAPGTFSFSFTGLATVAEGDALAGTGLTIAPTEGQAFTGAVATFTDANPIATAADFTADIDWGDGTLETGVAVTGPVGGPFTVAGSHTYAEEGSYAIGVTINEVAPGTATAAATGTATVAEAGFSLSAAGTLTATEGQANTDITVATFNPGAGDVAGDFVATIDWGDGTVTAGTVSDSGGGLSVTGTHTYAGEGTFIYSVTVAETDGDFTASPAIGATIIANADTLAASTTQPSVSVAEGDSTSIAVAAFTNAGYPTHATADFTASIDWGDGTTTAGTVTANGNGGYIVSGSHAYGDEGTFTATVTLTEAQPGAASATATNTVTVTEGDTLTATATPVTAAEGAALNDVQVATFTTTFVGNVAAGFTASIDWGDGTTSPGTITGGAGNFTVSGSHTYAVEGAYTTAVDIADTQPGTATATATGTATVANSDVLSGTAVAIGITAGETFTGPVATFTDTVAGRTAADFTASITWGDGATTTGTVTAAGGTFTVSGTHAYATPGVFPVAVTLAEAAPGTATTTAVGSATVTSPMPPLTGGDVVIPGTPGNDVLTIDRTHGGGASDITYILNGGPPMTLTGVTSFAFLGSDGDDTVTVDLTDGPLVTGAIAVDGGGGTDRLVVSAGGAAVLTQPGSILVGSQAVDYANVEATEIVAAAVNASAAVSPADRGAALAGLGADERFVQALYLAELGRAGSRAELDAWGALLHGSQGSPDQGRAAVAAAVAASPEARSHLVTGWYAAYLGRVPSAIELQGWVNLLRAGASQEDALAGILSSTEFATRVQSLVGPGPADEQYVRGLYRVLLGRDASAAEVAGFTGLLPAVTRQGLALGFLKSVEFRTAQFEGYYNTLLHRPAPAGEVAAWVASPFDIGTVRVLFESSAEFFANG
jgi:hypothetical protein